jgi:competence protein ComFC
MRCITCQELSFSIICNHCQSSLLTPSLSTRVLPDGFKVYSFYKYSEIEDLIKTKHTNLGQLIYKILAKNSFKNFPKNFHYPFLTYAIPIDDSIKYGYSHTAILAKELSSKYIKPIYSSLRSQNKVSYSGKTLEYRLKNRRDFLYSYKNGIEAIIIDDIITTGTTISEAKFTLEKSSVNPLFAITLVDASQK